MFFLQWESVKMFFLTKHDAFIKKSRPKQQVFAWNELYFSWYSLHPLTRQQIGVAKLLNGVSTFILIRWNSPAVKGFFRERNLGQYLFVTRLQIYFSWFGFFNYWFVFKYSLIWSIKLMILFLGKFSMYTYRESSN